MFEGLAIGCSLFLVLMFLSYVTMTAVPYVRRRSERSGDPDNFEWHFFVPARDEEVVIEPTVTALRTQFANAHVWVIDDGSQDATPQICAKLADDDPHVHVVTRRAPHAATGKGDALNHAYRVLTDWLPKRASHDHVIVGVIDADGDLDSHALDLLAGPDLFGADKVGGAQLLVRMKNRDELPPQKASLLPRRFGRWLVRMQDLEFVGPISAMQLLREHTGTVGLGGNGQFARLSALDAITENEGTPWHGALLEDFELGLHLLFVGFRNRYVFDAAVHQEGLPSVRKLIRQRSRWSQGALQCSTRYLGRVMRSNRFTSAGALEVGYFLIAPWTQLIGLVLWPTLYAMLAYRIITGPFSLTELPSVYWYVFALSVTTGFLPFAAWGPLYWYRKRDISFARSLWLGLSYFPYLTYMYLSAPLAFWRFIRRESGWVKTRRVAEAHRKSTPVNV
ncbi:glycosyltransferase [Cumulibacter soli]|uniref:glycosyltransferase n=1 Tax=Cumulibacter soli TaxID=2546344 RepID=UPI001067A29C|nr:glycosyltransferase family 2 protein [Cumulibacter soli]